MLTIVSGGQTGVDRAALDVAIELGIRVSRLVPERRLGRGHAQALLACWPFIPDYARRRMPTRASAPNGMCATAIA